MIDVIIVLRLYGSYNAVFLHIRNLYKTFLESYFFTFFIFLLRILILL